MILLCISMKNCNFALAISLKANMNLLCRHSFIASCDTLSPAIKKHDNTKTHNNLKWLTTYSKASVASYSVH